MGRSGESVLNMPGNAQYYSFRPAPLPPNPGLEIDGRMLELSDRAAASLAALNTASQLIPHMDLFVPMFLKKEALLSSQIEGTQCTMEDLLSLKIAHNFNPNISVVVNYISATEYALTLMNRLPLCGRFLREIHKVLLNGVREQERNTGEFRRSQNWIGPTGCSLQNAKYVPPNVEDMKDALAALERFITGSADYTALIRAALIHYQFETIHPFLDGNGRIGRLLILLYLMSQGVLSRPVLYVSYFLKANQSEYYERMSMVREKGNYEQWVCFFLEAVSTAAKDALDTIGQLEALHKKSFSRLPKRDRNSETQWRLLEHLEKQPIIDIRRASEELDLTYPPVSKAIQRLVEYGILVETTNLPRNRVYAYEEYLAILRQGT